MNKITQLLENVVRCKYFEAGVHIKNPIKNSNQNDLGRTTHTLDHVVVVHILICDKRKSQINEYSDPLVFHRGVGWFHKSIGGRLRPCCATTCGLDLTTWLEHV